MTKLDSRRLLMRGAACSVLTLVCATDALALGWGRAGSPLRRLPSSSRELTIHPLAAGAATPRGFSLGAVGLGDAAKQLLRDQLSNPLVEMRATGLGLGLRGSTESVDVRFFVAGVPFCERFQARAHDVNGALAVFATVPEVAPGAWAVGADEYTAGPADEAAAVAAAVADYGADAAARITGRRKCVAVRSGQLFPEIDYRIVVGGLPYQVRVGDGRVTNVSRDFFDVTGKAVTFEHNVLQGAPREVELKDLIGDGTLTTEFLKVVVPAAFPKAVATDHNFTYPITDQRFPQSQAFSSTQAHFEFARGLGFEWYGTKPLEVRLHVKPGGRSNNALYVPGSPLDNSPPTISVDDGDGIDLQNLATDGDVVSHEFGHHIIYRTLRSTEGQSLVLHEGLADFFAFARTGDGCLGESICPKDSGACILQGQCLRSADVPLVYNDQTWNQWAGPKYRLGHLHGQLISGVLWDMSKTGVFAAGDLPLMVHKAVTYFKEDSGFRDFMLALFLADCSLFQGRYRSAIDTAANARGLSEFFADVGVDCPSVPAPSGGGNSALPPAGSVVPREEKKETKGDENPLKCGVVPGDTDGQGGARAAAALILLLALALPLVAALRAPARERARSRTRRRR